MDTKQTPRQRELAERIKEMQNEINEIDEGAMPKKPDTDTCTECGEEFEKRKAIFAKMQSEAIIKTAFTKEGFAFMGEGANAEAIAKNLELTIKSTFETLEKDKNATLMLQLRVAMMFKDMM